MFLLRDHHIWMETQTPVCVIITPVCNILHDNHFVIILYEQQISLRDTDFFHFDNKLQFCIRANGGGDSIVEMELRNSPWVIL